MALQCSLVNAIIECSICKNGAASNDPSGNNCKEARETPA